MKKLLPFLLLIISCSLTAQTTNQKSIAKKYVTVDKKKYVITYSYYPWSYFEPSVIVYKLDSFGNETGLQDTAYYRRNRHYNSDIVVSRIIKFNSFTVVGGTQQGYYVQDDCFEDTPERVVMKAIHLQTIIDSNLNLRRINGIDAKYKYTVYWDEYKTGQDNTGFTINKVNKSKKFNSNKAGNEFILNQYKIINSGLDYRLDSTLSRKGRKFEM